MAWFLDLLAGQVIECACGHRGKGPAAPAGDPCRLSGLEQLEDRCLLSAVVAEHVFYNNSSFNGNNVAATVQDDNAIAPDTFPANYTPNAPGDTAVLGAVPLGSVSSTRR